MSRTPWAGFNNLYCAAGPLEWLDISVCVYVEMVKETDHEQCYMEHSGFLQQADKSSFIDVLHARICHTCKSCWENIRSGFKFAQTFGALRNV